MSMRASPRPSSGWSMRPSCYSGPTAVPVEPIGARLRPAYRDAHAGLQAGAIVLMSSGDISPPTNETRGDDYATSEIILAAQPDLVLTLGDNQYESASGATGDVQTPACGPGSPQLTWLGFAQQRRHGGQTSGQKCSIAVWHHERWGTSFFADDPATHEFWLTLNHFHADIVLSGHTHSTARMGPMNPLGHLSPSGGIRQITAGAGGRNPTPVRGNPAREGTPHPGKT